MHFFWIFRTSLEVYILIIPCFAFASEIIPVFSRKPIFGYPVMVGATVCIGFVSLSVWAHHMFTIGMNSYANSFFALTISMAVGVPTGNQDFQLATGTMWGGNIQFKTPMLFSIGFLFQFLIAGLTGIMMATAPLRLATGEFLFCRRALPLRDRRRNFCFVFSPPSITGIPKNDGKDVERKLWASCISGCSSSGFTSPSTGCTFPVCLACRAAFTYLRARPLAAGKYGISFPQRLAHSSRASPRSCYSGESYLFVSEGPGKPGTIPGMPGRSRHGQVSVAAACIQLRRHLFRRLRQVPPPIVGLANIQKICG